MAEDADLLARWREGDTRAGNEFVRRHFNAVFRFLRRRDANAAEDLAQKTFEAVLAAGQRAREVVNMRAYLFGVARNQLLMHLRKHGQAPSEPLAEARVGPRTPLTPSGVVAAKEEQKLLLRAMRTLSIDMQIALEMFYWEGLKQREIAEILEIAPGTVMSRLARAREMIREALETIDASEIARKSTITNIEQWARSLRGVVDQEA